MDLNQTYTQVQPTENYANPRTCLFHVIFKAAALAFYILSALFFNSFVIIFVVTVVLSALDFWVVKNVSGRILVGLRWWNEIDEQGESVWKFECLDQESLARMNKKDSWLFWWTLYLTAVVWIFLGIFSVIRFEPDYVLIVGVCLSLSLANIIGFTKCRKETLVHSTLDRCDDADFTFSVFFNMKEHTVYVRRRPYLQTFLERAAEMFEVMIFTASQSTYAEKLLNILDPEKKLISRRAYRESCIFSDGTYTKDLTVLGVDLAKVAIIDNSPQVFRLQVNNGIPIKSWFDDPSDRALISLLPFLETLVDADDVRPIIAKRYNNKE